MVINKIDRPDARPDEVHSEIFDLFVALGATEEQLDFPLQYASGRDGWSVAELKDERKSMEPLFKLILSHVPPPQTFGGPDAPFSMLASMLEGDSFLGRVITGRIHSGTIRPNMTVKVLDRTGKLVENGRITKIMRYQGLERTGDRGSDSRRYRRDRGPAQGDGFPHAVRCRGQDGDQDRAGRSADARDELFGQ